MSTLQTAKDTNKIKYERFVNQVDLNRPQHIAKAHTNFRFPDCITIK